MANPIITTTADQATSDGVKCVSYGRDGAGKTFGIPTAPRPFIFDVEGKTLSIAKYAIPSIRIRTWADWLDAYAWFREPSNNVNFDTLIVDSVSELSALKLSEEKIKGNNKGRAYGELRDAIATAIRNLIALPEKNVILNAKASLIELPDMTKIYAPSLPGTTAEQALGFYVNEMFYIGIGEYDGPVVNGVSSKVRYRYLQTEQDAQVQARDNSLTLLPKEPVDYAAIFKKIKARAS